MNVIKTVIAKLTNKTVNTEHKCACGKDSCDCSEGHCGCNHEHKAEATEEHTHQCACGGNCGCN